VRTPNRWLIAAAGVIMQIALGAVYAWSVFRAPLTHAYGWTIFEVTFAFTLAIFVLGVAAFAGGEWMRRSGPRRVAVAAGVFYGLGVFLTSYSADRLWLLYASYGLVAGTGLGLGYIVPVATLVKWFPDRRGTITGVAVAGFGAGALITAPIATRLIQQVGPMQTFAILGVVYFLAVTGGGLFMQNPPAGYAPAGWTPTASQRKQRAERPFTLREAVTSWQWYGLWALLFLNVSAGISIISQAAPMAQEITGISAVGAAGIVGLMSIANGLGRFMWASLSDVIGRRQVFLAMFPLQAVVFALLPSVRTPAAFTILACAILLCYGGGFGTMPAFVADYFGADHVGSIYGLMLTAWGCAGVFGPMLIAALRESNGRYQEALFAIAVVMLVATCIPMFVGAPPPPQPASPRPLSGVGGAGA
jgi:MFS transporter, OFA family, oxalate/formate antiporter